MPLGEIDGPLARPDLGVGDAADQPHFDGTVGLLWRSLVLWVFVLIVLSAMRVL